MQVYLPRFYTAGLEANLATLARDCAEASAAGCELAVFPELFLTGYRGEGDPAELRARFAALSKSYSEVLFAFGCINEEGVNRLPVYRGGRQLAAYDKVHLFLPNGEGELWRPGTRYLALAHGGVRYGLLTCNDIRFPEQARALKLAYDVDAYIVPALWPWERDNVWAALLRARALENNAFVIGCCVAGVDNGVERFDGAGNHVYDPLGNELQPVQRCCELDLKLLSQVTVDTRAQYIEIAETQLYEG